MYNSGMKIKRRERTGAKQNKKEEKKKAIEKRDYG